MWVNANTYKNISQILHHKTVPSENMHKNVDKVNGFVDSIYAHVASIFFN